MVGLHSSNSVGEIMVLHCRRPLNDDLQCAMNLGPKGLRRHEDVMSVCCLDAVWLWCIRIHRTTGAELHICMARWLEMLVCAVRRIRAQKGLWHKAWESALCRL